MTGLRGWMCRKAPYFVVGVAINVPIAPAVPQGLPYPDCSCEPLCLITTGSYDRLYATFLAVRTYLLPGVRLSTRFLGNRSLSYEGRTRIRASRYFRRSGGRFQHVTTQGYACHHSSRLSASLSPQPRLTSDLATIDEGSGGVGYGVSPKNRRDSGWSPALFVATPKIVAAG